MNKSYTLIIFGFLFLGLGLLSIILSLVGLRLDILAFLSKWSLGSPFIIYLIMLFGGVVMIYYGKNGEKLKREAEEN